MFLKWFSFAHLGCIYLLNSNCEIFLQFKITFLFYFIIKCNLFLWWQSWIFSSHYFSLQCHMILQKSFLYAWCPKHISYNYHCWKQLWKLWYILSKIQWLIKKLKRTAPIWNRNTFCNIRNYFTVNSGQFNASLLNKRINVLIQKKLLINVIETFSIH